MNGIVAKWLCRSGNIVAVGESLGILEAMKMEMPIVADRAGVFTSSVEEGAIVKEGQTLGVIA